MRVFLTGATGFIGQAVSRELLAAGHDVLALARSDDAAKALAADGLESLRGDLSSPDTLASAARQCDGVIHTAYNHDWSVPRDVAAETDLRVVTAIAGALEGSGKPLVISSGTALLAAGRVAIETDSPTSASMPRAASEAAVIAASSRGVRGSIMRLPPTVHGGGDHGFVPMLIDLARRKGFAAYVGDGANRWPAVHRMDAARLYRLALEKAAPGARLHAVHEEGVAMRDIAAAIGEGIGVPVQSFTPEEAKTHLEWFAHYVALDNPTSSAHTRETMHWSPEENGLLTDMRESEYFS